MANGLASVKKAGKVRIAASGSRDIVTTAKTMIKVKYISFTTSQASQAMSYFNLDHKSSFF